MGTRASGAKWPRAAPLLAPWLPRCRAARNSIGTGRLEPVGRRLLNTYAVLGLALRARHQEESGALVVSLLAGQVERRELGLCESW